MGTINVGIIGCGGIAQTMAHTVRKTRGFKAYAAASRNLDKARGFAERNHFKLYYGSYEDMLKDRKVDLVYIATPHSEHYANARMCIEHGKPCLVEKAFTVNEAQAKELFRLAESENVFITEAMWIRYMPFVRTIREVLSSGVIGEPVMLSANLGYPVKNNDRLTNPRLAGGSLLDLGVYPVNLAAMLFGTDLLRVEASCTYTTQHLDEQDNITFIYRDGRTAVLSATMLGVTDRRGVISGTRGYIVLDNINNFEGMTVYDAHHRRIAGYRRPRQTTGYEYELKACRMALDNHWLECPEMTHADSLMMLHIMDDIRAQLGIVYPCELPQDRQTQETAATWQDTEHPAQPAPAAGDGEQACSGPTQQMTGTDAQGPAADAGEIPLPSESIHEAAAAAVVPAPDSAPKETAAEPVNVCVQSVEQETEAAPADGQLQEQKMEEAPADGQLQEQKMEAAPADEQLHEQKMEAAPADGQSAEQETEAAPADEQPQEQETETVPAAVQPQEQVPGT